LISFEALGNRVRLVQKFLKELSTQTAKEFFYKLLIASFMSKNNAKVFLKPIISENVESSY
jgi:hypothetical protein